MEVLEEIIAWASALPLWQQVALIKILKQDDLSDQDINDLADLSIEEASDLEALKAKLKDPLKDYKHEDKDETDRAVVIEAITKTKNINAIKDDSVLGFGESGLTVIYGNNAVGKSGFTRIFKAACMCRDNEQVHGDVSREETDEPAATITYKAVGAAKSYEWTQHASSDASLKTVHIFDSRAARVYLTDENDVKYVPAGLDVFDKMADAFNEVKGAIDSKSAQQKASMVSLEALFDTYQDTKAYELIQKLDEPATEKQITAINKLSSEEEQEQAKLKKQITEKEANHPTKRQETLRLKWQRHARLNNMMVGLKKKLKTEEVNAMLAARKKMHEAFKVAKTAQKQKFKSEEYLAGTGDNLWKSLWQASKDYSEKKAYPEHEFPHTESGSKCVLCQRELDQDTGARFIEFNAFMADKSQELAKTAKDEYEKKLTEFQEIDRVSEEVADEAFAELESEEYPGKEKLKQLLKELDDTHSKIVIELKKEDENIQVERSKFDFAPLDKFRKHLDAIAAEAKNFDIVKFNQALAEDKKRLAELESRALLGKYEKEVKKEIKDYANLRLLKKAAGTTDTSRLSRKGGELKQRYLVGSLKDTFDTELQSIYRDGLIVELQQARTRYGVTYSEIVLSSATAPHTGLKPEEVMSESEQKVISLAGYFAELSLSPHTSAIVLDDPVTSLDHFNIERIAKRIVQESSKRQVIVFTHNVVFASHLMDEADAQSVLMTAKTISKMPQPGKVSEGLPWDAKSVKARVGWLRNKLQTLSAAHRSGDVDTYNEGGELFYKKLRETWERAIEEHLFANVVKRYKRDIETKRLRNVKIIDTDYDIVDENMSNCTSFVHDSPGEDTVQIPVPNELEQDLKKLTTWIDEIKQR